MGGLHLIFFGSPNYYNMIQMHLYISKCFNYNDNLIRTIDLRNDKQKVLK